MPGTGPVYAWAKSDDGCPGAERWLCSLQNLLLTTMHHLQRVISGGQTGIDQLGLEVARQLGIPTGGVAPKGYLTETGPDLTLRDHYGLREHESAHFPPRTRANVRQSDGTVIMGELSGGTKLTRATCQKEGKPYLVNPTADELRTWLVDKQIKVLNVAGNRGSKLPSEAVDRYRQVLVDAFTNQPSIP
jgi:hypothetical protein